MKNRIPALLIAAVTTAADLVTKSLVFEALSPREIRWIFGDWFALTRVLNPGVTGGLGGELPTWVKTVPIAILVVGIGVYLVRSRTLTRVSSLALALILGGAAGNLYDRIRFGEVRDFLDVWPRLSWPSWSWLHHWPTFNVADAAIVVGFVLLMFLSLFGKKRKVAASD